MRSLQCPIVSTKLASSESVFIGVLIIVECGTANPQMSRWAANRSKSRYRFIGLSVFGSRNQAKDHGLRTVQRTAYPT